MTALLHYDDGVAVPLQVDRWIATATREERVLLRSVKPPVLDVGCGPGRHVVALAERGIVALGVDVSPVAVRLAHRTGAPVLERSIFDDVPAAGRWGTTLLLDGNIGIGGDPRSLLRRSRDLMHRRGRALVELEGRGAPTRRAMAWIERDGATSPRFPWARVSVDDIDDLAASTGFILHRAWTENGRWFARLDVG